MIHDDECLGNAVEVARAKELEAVRLIGPLREANRTNDPAGDDIKREILGCVGGQRRKAFSGLNFDRPRLALFADRGAIKN